jgi:hypothetical protein
MSKGHEFEFEKMAESKYPDSINFTIPAWKAWCLVREILGQLEKGDKVIEFSGCGLLTHDEEEEHET